jgi:hypothetical protein
MPGRIRSSGKTPGSRSGCAAAGSANAPSTAKIIRKPLERMALFSLGEMNPE